MNPGGEPERDDTGLPPVDIEIPDDARDLDRDVQAYYRELRALRRDERRGRWHRSLSKDGVVLPLLACFLILALITGTLLTVFTATSNTGLTGLPGSANSTPTGSSSPAAAMFPNQTLPDARITPDATAGALDVDTLGPVILELVPPGCGCTETFRWLARVASTAHVDAYVIYTPTASAEAQALYKKLDPQLSTGVKLAVETDNQLSAARARLHIPAGQLAAILVGPRPDQPVTWVSGMGPRDSQAPLVKVLSDQSS